MNAISVFKRLSRRPFGAWSAECFLCGTRWRFLLSNDRGKILTRVPRLRYYLLLIFNLIVYHASFFFSLFKHFRFFFLLVPSSPSTTAVDSSARLRRAPATKIHLIPYRLPRTSHTWTILSLSRSFYSRVLLIFVSFRDIHDIPSVVVLRFGQTVSIRHFSPVENEARARANVVFNRFERDWPVYFGAPCSLHLNRDWTSNFSQGSRSLFLSLCLCVCGNKV